MVDLYKLSIPLMASTINEKNRDTYLNLCRKAGAKRVFLAIETFTDPISPTIYENVAFFKENGFEVGIWTDTIGHGRVLEHVENGNATERFPQMIDIAGEARSNANCPLGEDFRRSVSERVAEFANTGAQIVMLDDDFRMSQHRGDICCACPMHLKRMGEYLGEEITLDKIRPYIISGKPNKYRDAWLKAQNDGLMETARLIREKVDEKHPEVTVALCVSSTVWNVDGVDVNELVRILAGKNQPILRLTGAPYWAYSRGRKFSLISVFEIARMLASFVGNEGFDLMSEGDVYPRPRYTCPASYLELYDAVTRADGGYDGILKYMFDYVAGPQFETGYLHFHEENMNTYKKLGELFKNGANAGVRVMQNKHTFKNADLDLSSLHELSPLPTDGVMLSSNGIPTIYRGKGVCSSVFGENARSFENLSDEKGLILDAVSAVILSERGIDVGLSGYESMGEKNITFVYYGSPEYKSFIENGRVRALNCSLKKGAEPVLFMVTDKGVEPMAYRYENKDGKRFLVFLFEGDSINTPNNICVSGLLKNYATQKALLEMIPWVARKNIPAYCEGNPELYLMCEKRENEMSVALFNCFPDGLVNKEVVLDEEYSSVECVNCEAEISGNIVKISSGVQGFSYALFRVHK